MITAIVMTVNRSIAVIRNLSYFRCIKNKRIRDALSVAMMTDVSDPDIPNFMPETATVSTVNINRQSQTIT